MSRIPKEIRCNPIGIIHSPYRDIKGMPLQPTGAKGIQGTIEIKKKYAKGLNDLEGFSHIVLICHFHRSKGYSLEVEPFLHESLRGVFSTRAPKTSKSHRHIGCQASQGRRLCTPIEDVDILDGTPLLDIKPYVPAFDIRKTKTIGWLSKKIDKVVR
ncbi:MAG TPA: tRNA (N6-threonylcarbamoyladenosine(37)-N6)-methyltransferase TrmO [Nitrospiraceae bacterium]|jgi:tRNA-Thr(GGU) m(6)t(6)A37 methyltransferase TsaA|nr:tRNA (N6-threonylcarbamoyladenosine(37)-N6)-methyltransferase TrmO [Nitrospiraceae bacterium]